MVTNGVHRFPNAFGRIGSASTLDERLNNLFNCELKRVNSLPNPDPSDIEALDAKPVLMKDVVVDQAAEAKWLEAKRQAQGGRISHRT
jgi:hypothetical protein